VARIRAKDLKTTKLVTGYLVPFGKIFTESAYLEYTARNLVHHAQILDSEEFRPIATPGLSLAIRLGISKVKILNPEDTGLAQGKAKGLA
jgi:hypothetical protein